MCINVGIGQIGEIGMSYKAQSFLIILFICLGFYTQVAWAKTAKEIYRDYKDSVLLVVSEEDGGVISTGTAFAIDEDGTFLTAAHVIFESKKAVLINRNKESFEVKQTLWIDSDADLAIIKTDKAGFKPIPLLSYKAVEVGERLTVVSYPKGNEAGGLDSTLSEGLLSSVRESFISERVGKESPTYDKQNPQIFKAETFYKEISKNCQVNQEQKENIKVMRCSNGKKLMLDLKNQNILYENYDIAIKKGTSIYYFANTNTNLYNPKKMIGAMLQYTTPISVGSSGGPIFNENGEVLAVVNSYLDDAQNINFGRPIDYLPQEYLNKNQLATKNLNEVKVSGDGAYLYNAILKVHMKAYEGEQP
jgi:hypothetical protein